MGAARGPPKGSYCDLGVLEELPAIPVTYRGREDHKANNVDAVRLLVLLMTQCGIQSRQCMRACLDDPQIGRAAQLCS